MLVDKQIYPGSMIQHIDTIINKVYPGSGNEKKCMHACVEWAINNPGGDMTELEEEVVAKLIDGPASRWHARVLRCAKFGLLKIK